MSFENFLLQLVIILAAAEVGAELPAAGLTVGLAHRLINIEMFAAIVLMVMATTFVTPPLLKATLLPLARRRNETLPALRGPDRSLWRRRSLPREPGVSPVASAAGPLHSGTARPGDHNNHLKEVLVPHA